MSMPQRARYDVAVIGAGVFGAWIAWFLAHAGRRVLLVDQYGFGHTRGSSGGESRVIRMAYGPDAIYTRMAQRSLQLWRSLFERMGRPELFQGTGVLWMALEGNAAADASVTILREHAIAHEVLAANELRRRWPQISVPDNGWAIFEPESGGLLARRAVQAVVADALAAGVQVLHERVLPITASGGSVQQLETASGQPIEADMLVYACGPWLGKIWPELLGPRIFTSRQEVFYFGTPAANPAFSAANLPTWMDFAREWYGLPDIEGRGFKLACDVHGAAIDPDSTERLVSTAGIHSAREFLARRFPLLASAPLLAAEVCQYENSSNGDFLIDRHPQLNNVWLVGGGSGHGFKHGPAVGEYFLHCSSGQIKPEPRFSLASKQLQQARAVH